MYVVLVLAWMGSNGCWQFSNLRLLSTSRVRSLIAIKWICCMDGHLKFITLLR